MNSLKTTTTCHDSLKYLEDTGICSLKSIALDYASLSIERICCNRHFGGMPIEDAIAIVRKHAPEYFI